MFRKAFELLFSNDGTALREIDFRRFGRLFPSLIQPFLGIESAVILVTCDCHYATDLVVVRLVLTNSEDV